MVSPSNIKTNDQISELMVPSLASTDHSGWSPCDPSIENLEFLLHLLFSERKDKGLRFEILMGNSGIRNGNYEDIKCFFIST